MKFRYITIISLFLITLSCEEFIEVEVPNHKIVSETVFSNNETANSAVVGILNELFKADFSNGSFRSVTMLAGLSADNFQTTALVQKLNEFSENEISINNSYNLELWASAYNIIYMCNAVLEGLSVSDGVSMQMKGKLMAETQFVRAFVYFYLVNLYGDVPIVKSTDYRKNALAVRSDLNEIYNLIIDDLNKAVEVLGGTYENEERLRPNRFTALALLARVYLYREDWERAEKCSSQVIASTENFMLLNNLDEVFLSNSREAIWQISPAGNGALSFITNEARIFILTSPPPNSQQPVALSSEFIESFYDDDLRKDIWIGQYHTENGVYHYPSKYKNNIQEEITEYNMVLRVSEQYLIRAEAYAQQGKIQEAVADLNNIRRRANLELISSNLPSIGQKALIDSIRVEKNKELFSEWGHRWLDLKRARKASNILSNIKSSWQETDLLYPIPEEEMHKNPNLTQNNGY